MSASHTPPAIGVGPWAQIDVEAIRHNLRWVLQRVQQTINPAGVQPRAHESPRVNVMSRAFVAAPANVMSRPFVTPPASATPQVWAVVKANAYGHGIDVVLPALSDADGACVSSFNDVLHLRQLGWRKPILLLSFRDVNWRDLTDPALGELHVVIEDELQLQMLEAIADEKTKPSTWRLHAWLRYEGELRSHGFSARDYSVAFRRLLLLKKKGWIIEAGHMHHYATAEYPDTLRDERRGFAAATESLPGPHCTGSSGALCGPGPGVLHANGHWLRSGLLLYGASPLPGITGPDIGLRPAMTLQARLLTVRRVKAGERVGYGDDYRAPRDTWIGTVGIGYGHGIPRRLWQYGRVLAGDHGRPVPLAGRVAMETLTVDLGSDPREKVGAIMTLWGRTPNGDVQPVETVAAACDTIAAELLSSLTARVPVCRLTASTTALHRETML